MTVTCPHCRLAMPWTLQPKRVVVRCPNREITQLRPTGDVKEQYGMQVYGTTDRKKVWIERYLEDGPRRKPRWFCWEVFAVRAA